MRRWDRDKRGRARIEIIPMIDVMLFLLVFFVLISINVIPAAGVQVRLPLSASAEMGTTRYNALISLGSRGELQLDGNRVTLETLVARLRAIKKRHPQVTAVINGDEAVELQRVVAVMDRVKAAGVQSVSIASRKQPMP